MRCGFRSAPRRRTVSWSRRSRTSWQKRRDAVTKAPPLFNRLALIGTGLIGGSIARAARALRIVQTVVVTSRSETTRGRVRELGFADEVLDTAAAAVAD